MKRTTLQAALAAALPALMLSGCYYIQVDQELLGRLGAMAEMPKVPPSASPGASSPATAGASAVSANGMKTVPPTAPMSLPARLYPMNEVANENGLISGSVTNMMNGKGRVQLTYRGEMLVGEATRVSGDDRKGIASAWGPSGSFMSCEYQMSAPVRGAGTCIFSDGARYQVHVGN
ncbi:MAG TPA: hypothetical protein VIV54_07320 [Burkholderiales bacterium]